MVAALAAQAVTAERGRAATGDRGQHLDVLSSKPLAAADKETLSSGANQIRHFQRRLLHLLAQRSELQRIQRRVDAAQMSRRDMQIDRRLLQIAMT